MSSKVSIQNGAFIALLRATQNYTVRTHTTNLELTSCFAYLNKRYDDVGNIHGNKMLESERHEKSFLL